MYLIESSEDIGIKQVDAEHRASGAVACGYHYVIRKDGTVEQGRPDETIGWHNPRMNFDSVAVAFIVDPGGQMSLAQADSGILTTLLVKYPQAKIEHAKSPR